MIGLPILNFGPLLLRLFCSFDLIKLFSSHFLATILCSNMGIHFFLYLYYHLHVSLDQGGRGHISSLFLSMSPTVL